ncbi:MAG: hypothetical protein PHF25_00395 [Candidatus Margulisbacteria bacterium]|nr:hypothetical protein [Candidatus Margulisiibacteriota bacterium]
MGFGDGNIGAFGGYGSSRTSIPAVSSIPEVKKVKVNQEQELSALSANVVFPIDKRGNLVVPQELKQLIAQGRDLAVMVTFNDDSQQRLVIGESNKDLLFQLDSKDIFAIQVGIVSGKGDTTSPSIEFGYMPEDLIRLRENIVITINEKNEIKWPTLKSVEDKDYSFKVGNVEVDKSKVFNYDTNNPIYLIVKRQGLVFSFKLKLERKIAETAATKKIQSADTIFTEAVSPISEQVTIKGVTINENKAVMPTLDAADSKVKALEENGYNLYWKYSNENGTKYLPFSEGSIALADGYYDQGNISLYIGKSSIKKSEINNELLVYSETRLDVQAVVALKSKVDEIWSFLIDQGILEKTDSPEGSANILVSTDEIEQILINSSFDYNTKVILFQLLTKSINIDLKVDLDMYVSKDVDFSTPIPTLDVAKIEINREGNASFGLLVKEGKVSVSLSFQQKDLAIKLGCKESDLQKLFMKAQENGYVDALTGGLVITSDNLMQIKELIEDVNLKENWDILFSSVELPMDIQISSKSSAYERKSVQFFIGNQLNLKKGEILVSWTNGVDSLTLAPEVSNQLIEVERVVGVNENRVLAPEIEGLLGEVDMFYAVEGNGISSFSRINQYGQSLNELAIDYLLENEATVNRIRQAIIDNKPIENKDKVFIYDLLFFGFNKSRLINDSMFSFEDSKSVDQMSISGMFLRVEVLNVLFGKQFAYLKDFSDVFKMVFNQQEYKAIAYQRTNIDTSSLEVLKQPTDVQSSGDSRAVQQSNEDNYVYFVEKIENFENLFEAYVAPRNQQMEEIQQMLHMYNPAFADINGQKGIRSDEMRYLANLFSEETASAQEMVGLFQNNQQMIIQLYNQYPEVRKIIDDAKLQAFVDPLTISLLIKGQGESLNTSGIKNEQFIKQASAINLGITKADGTPLTLYDLLVVGNQLLTGISGTLIKESFKYENNSQLKAYSILNSRAVFGYSISQVYQSLEQKLLSKLRGSNESLIEIFSGTKLYQFLVDEFNKDSQGIATVEEYCLSYIQKKFEAKYSEIESYLKDGKGDGSAIQMLIEHFAGSAIDRKVLGQIKDVKIVPNQLSKSNYSVNPDKLNEPKYRAAILNLVYQTQVNKTQGHGFRQTTNVFNQINIYQLKEIINIISSDEDFSELIKPLKELVATLENTGCVLIKSVASGFEYYKADGSFVTVAATPLIELVKGLVDRNILQGVVETSKTFTAKLQKSLAADRDIKVQTKVISFDKQFNIDSWTRIRLLYLKQTNIEAYNNIVAALAKVEDNDLSDPNVLRYLSSVYMNPTFLLSQNKPVPSENLFMLDADFALWLIDVIQSDSSAFLGADLIVDLVFGRRQTFTPDKKTVLNYSQGDIGEALTEIRNKILEGKITFKNNETMLLDGDSPEMKKLKTLMAVWIHGVDNNAIQKLVDLKDSTAEPQVADLQDANNLFGSSAVSFINQYFGPVPSLGSWLTSGASKVAGLPEVGILTSNIKDAFSGLITNSAYNSDRLKSEVIYHNLILSNNEMSDEYVDVFINGLRSYINQTYFHPSSELSKKEIEELLQGWESLKDVEPKGNYVITQENCKSNLKYLYILKLAAVASFLTMNDGLGRSQELVLVDGYMTGAEKKEPVSDGGGSALGGLAWDLLKGNNPAFVFSEGYQYVSAVSEEKKKEGHVALGVGVGDATLNYVRTPLEFMKLSWYFKFSRPLDIWKSVISQVSGENNVLHQKEIASQVALVTAQIDIIRDLQKYGESYGLSVAVIGDVTKSIVGMENVIKTIRNLTSLKDIEKKKLEIFVLLSMYINEAGVANKDSLKTELFEQFKGIKEITVLDRYIKVVSKLIIMKKDGLSLDDSSYLSMLKNSDGLLVLEEKIKEKYQKSRWDYLEGASFGGYEADHSLGAFQSLDEDIDDLMGTVWKRVADTAVEVATIQLDIYNFTHSFYQFYQYLGIWEDMSNAATPSDWAAVWIKINLANMYVLPKSGQKFSDSWMGRTVGRDVILWKPVGWVADSAKFLGADRMKGLQWLFKGIDMLNEQGALLTLMEATGVSGKASDKWENLTKKDGQYKSGYLALRALVDVVGTMSIVGNRDYEKAQVTDLTDMSKFRAARLIFNGSVLRSLGDTVFSKGIDRLNANVVLYALDKWKQEFIGNYPNGKFRDYVKQIFHECAGDPAVARYFERMSYDSFQAETEKSVTEVTIKADGSLSFYCVSPDAKRNIDLSKLQETLKFNGVLDGISVKSVSEDGTSINPKEVNIGKIIIGSSMANENNAVFVLRSDNPSFSKDNLELHLSVDLARGLTSGASSSMAFERCLNEIKSRPLQLDAGFKRSIANFGTDGNSVSKMQDFYTLVTNDTLIVINEDVFKALNGKFSFQELSVFFRLIKEQPNNWKMNIDSVNNYLEQVRFRDVVPPDFRKAADIIFGKAEQLARVFLEHSGGIRGSVFDEKFNEFWKNNAEVKSALASIGSDLDSYHVDGEKRERLESFISEKSRDYAKGVVLARQSHEDLWSFIEGQKASLKENGNSVLNQLLDSCRNIDDFYKACSIGVEGKDSRNNPDAYKAALQIIIDAQREDCETAFNAVKGANDEEAKKAAKGQPHNKRASIDEFQKANADGKLTSKVLGMWTLSVLKSEGFRPIEGSLATLAMQANSKDMFFNMNAGGGKTILITGLVLFRYMMGYHVVVGVSNDADKSAGVKSTTRVYETMFGKPPAVYERPIGAYNPETLRAMFAKSRVVYVNHSDFLSRALQDIINPTERILPTDSSDSMVYILDEADKNLLIDGTNPTIMSTSNNEILKGIDKDQYVVAVRVMDAFIKNNAKKEGELVFRVGDQFFLTEKGTLEFKRMLAIDILKVSMSKIVFSDNLPSVREIQSRIDKIKLASNAREISLQLNSSENLMYERVAFMANDVLDVTKTFICGEQYDVVKGKVKLLDQGMRRFNWSSVQQKYHQIVEAYHLSGSGPRRNDGSISHISRPSFSSISLTTQKFQKDVINAILGLSGTNLEMHREIERLMIEHIPAKDIAPQTLKFAPQISVNGLEAQKQNVLFLAASKMAEGAPILLHIPKKKSGKSGLEAELTIQVFEEYTKDFFDFLDKKIKDNNYSDKQFDAIYQRLGGGEYLVKYQAILDFNALVGRFFGSTKSSSGIGIDHVFEGTADDLEKQRIDYFGDGTIRVLMSTNSNRAVDIQPTSEFFKESWKKMISDKAKPEAKKRLEALAKYLNIGVDELKGYKAHDALILLRRKSGYSNIGMVGVMTQLKRDSVEWIQEIFRLGRTLGLGRSEGAVYGVTNIWDNNLSKRPELQALVRDNCFTEEGISALMDVPFYPLNSMLQIDNIGKYLVAIPEDKEAIDAITKFAYGILKEFHDLSLKSDLSAVEKKRLSQIKSNYRGLVSLTKNIPELFAKREYSLPGNLADITDEGLRIAISVGIFRDMTGNEVGSICSELAKSHNPSKGKESIDWKAAEGRIYNYRVATDLVLVGIIKQNDVSDFIKDGFENNKFIHLKQSVSMFNKVRGSLEKTNRDNMESSKASQGKTLERQSPLRLLQDLLGKSQGDGKRSFRLGYRATDIEYISRDFSQLNQVKDIPTMLTMFFERALEVNSKQFCVSQGISSLDELMVKMITNKSVRRKYESYINSKMGFNVEYVSGVREWDIFKSGVSKSFYGLASDPKMPKDRQAAAATLISQRLALVNVYLSEAEKYIEHLTATTMVIGSDVNYESLWQSMQEGLIDKMAIDMFSDGSRPKTILKKTVKNVADFFYFKFIYDVDLKVEKHRAEHQEAINEVNYKSWNRLSDTLFGWKASRALKGNDNYKNNPEEKVQYQLKNLILRCNRENRDPSDDELKLIFGEKFSISANYLQANDFGAIMPQDVLAKFGLNRIVNSQAIALFFEQFTITSQGYYWIDAEKVNDFIAWLDNSKTVKDAETIKKFETLANLLLQKKPVKSKGVPEGTYIELSATDKKSLQIKLGEIRDNQPDALKVEYEYLRQEGYIDAQGRILKGTEVISKDENITAATRNKLTTAVEKITSTINQINQKLISDGNPSGKSILIYDGSYKFAEVISVDEQKDHRVIRIGRVWGGGQTDYLGLIYHKQGNRFAFGSETSSKYEIIVAESKLQESFMDLFEKAISQKSDNNGDHARMFLQSIDISIEKMKGLTGFPSFFNYKVLGQRLGIKSEDEQIKKYQDWRRLGYVDSNGKLTEKFMYLTKEDLSTEQEREFQSKALTLFDLSGKALQMLSEFVRIHETSHMRDFKDNMLADMPEGIRKDPFVDMLLEFSADFGKDGIIEKIIAMDGNRAQSKAIFQYLLFRLSASQDPTDKEMYQVLKSCVGSKGELDIPKLNTLSKRITKHVNSTFEALKQNSSEYNLANSVRDQQSRFSVFLGEISFVKKSEVSGADSKSPEGVSYMKATALPEKGTPAQRNQSDTQPDATKYKDVEYISTPHTEGDYKRAVLAISDLGQENPNQVFEVKSSTKVQIIFTAEDAKTVQTERLVIEGFGDELGKAIATGRQDLSKKQQMNLYSYILQQIRNTTELSDESAKQQANSMLKSSLDSIQPGLGDKFEKAYPSFKNCFDAYSRIISATQQQLDNGSDKQKVNLRKSPSGVVISMVDRAINDSNATKDGGSLTSEQPFYVIRGSSAEVIVRMGLMPMFFGGEKYAGKVGSVEFQHQSWGANATYQDEQLLMRMEDEDALSLKGKGFGLMMFAADAVDEGQLAGKPMGFSAVIQKDNNGKMHFLDGQIVSKLQDDIYSKVRGGSATSITDELIEKAVKDTNIPKEQKSAYYEFMKTTLDRDVVFVRRAFDELGWVMTEDMMKNYFSSRGDSLGDIFRNDGTMDPQKLKEHAEGLKNTLLAGMTESQKSKLKGQGLTINQQLERMLYPGERSSRIATDVLENSTQFLMVLAVAAVIQFTNAKMKNEKFDIESVVNLAFNELTVTAALMKRMMIERGLGVLYHGEGVTSMTISVMVSRLDTYCRARTEAIHQMAEFNFVRQTEREQQNSFNDLLNTNVEQEVASVQVVGSDVQSNLGISFTYKDNVLSGEGVNQLLQNLQYPGDYFITDSTFDVLNNLSFKALAVEYFKNTGCLVLGPMSGGSDVKYFVSEKFINMMNYHPDEIMSGLVKLMKDFVVGMDKEKTIIKIKELGVDVEAMGLQDKNETELRQLLVQILVSSIVRKMKGSFDVRYALKEQLKRVWVESIIRDGYIKEYKLADSDITEKGQYKPSFLQEMHSVLESKGQDLLSSMLSDVKKEYPDFDSIQSHYFSSLVLLYDERDMQIFNEFLLQNKIELTSEQLDKLKIIKDSYSDLMSKLGTILKSYKNKNWDNREMDMLLFEIDQALVSTFPKLSEFIKFADLVELTRAELLRDRMVSVDFNKAFPYLSVNSNEFSALTVKYVNDALNKSITENRVGVSDVYSFMFSDNDKLKPNYSVIFEAIEVDGKMCFKLKDGVDEKKLNKFLQEQQNNFFDSRQFVLLRDLAITSLSVSNLEKVQTILQGTEKDYESYSKVLYNNKDLLGDVFGFYSTEDLFVSQFKFEVAGDKASKGLMENTKAKDGMPAPKRHLIVFREQVSDYANDNKIPLLEQAEAGNPGLGTAKGTAGGIIGLATFKYAHGFLEGRAIRKWGQYDKANYNNKFTRIFNKEGLRMPKICGHTAKTHFAPMGLASLAYIMVSQHFFNIAYEKSGAVRFVVDNSIDPFYESLAPLKFLTPSIWLRYLNDAQRNWSGFDPIGFSGLKSSDSSFNRTVGTVGSLAVDVGLMKLDVEMAKLVHRRAVKAGWAQAPLDADNLLTPYQRAINEGAEDLISRRGVMINNSDLSKVKLARVPRGVKSVVDSLSPHCQSISSIEGSDDLLVKLKDGKMQRLTYKQAEKLSADLSRRATGLSVTMNARDIVREASSGIFLDFKPLAGDMVEFTTVGGKKLVVGKASMDQALKDGKGDLYKFLFTDDATGQFKIRGNRLMQIYAALSVVNILINGARDGISMDDVAQALVTAGKQTGSVAAIGLLEGVATNAGVINLTIRGAVVKIPLAGPYAAAAYECLSVLIENWDEVKSGGISSSIAIEEAVEKALVVGGAVFVGTVTAKAVSVVIASMLAETSAGAAVSGALPVALLTVATAALVYYAPKAYDWGIETTGIREDRDEVRMLANFSKEAGVTLEITNSNVHSWGPFYWSNFFQDTKNGYYDNENLQELMENIYPGYSSLKASLGRDNPAFVIENGSGPTRRAPSIFGKLHEYSNLAYELNISVNSLYDMNPNLFIHICQTLEQNKDKIKGKMVNVSIERVGYQDQPDFMVNYVVKLTIDYPKDEIRLTMGAQEKPTEIISPCSIRLHGKGISLSEGINVFSAVNTGKLVVDGQVVDSLKVVSTDRTWKDTLIDEGLGRFLLETFIVKGDINYEGLKYNSESQGYEEWSNQILKDNKALIAGMVQKYLVTGELPINDPKYKNIIIAIATEILEEDIKRNQNKADSALLRLTQAQRNKALYEWRTLDSEGKRISSLSDLSGKERTGYLDFLKAYRYLSLGFINPEAIATIVGCDIQEAKLIVSVLKQSEVLKGIDNNQNDLYRIDYKKITLGEDELKEFIDVLKNSITDETFIGFGVDVKNENILRIAAGIETVINSALSLSEYVYFTRQPRDRIRKKEFALSGDDFRNIYMLYKNGAFNKRDSGFLQFHPGEYTIVNKPTHLRQVFPFDLLSTNFFADNLSVSERLMRHSKSFNQSKFYKYVYDNYGSLQANDYDKYMRARGFISISNDSEVRSATLDYLMVANYITNESSHFFESQARLDYKKTYAFRCLPDEQIAESIKELDITAREDIEDAFRLWQYDSFFQEHKDSVLFKVDMSPSALFIRNDYQSKKQLNISLFIFRVIRGDFSQSQLSRIVASRGKFDQILKQISMSDIKKLNLIFTKLSDPNLASIDRMNALDYIMENSKAIKELYDFMFDNGSLYYGWENVALVENTGYDSIEKSAGDDVKDFQNFIKTIALFKGVAGIPSLYSRSKFRTYNFNWMNNENFIESYVSLKSQRERDSKYFGSMEYERLASNERNELNNFLINNGRSEVDGTEQPSLYASDFRRLDKNRQKLVELYRTLAYANKNNDIKSADHSIYDIAMITGRPQLSELRGLDSFVAEIKATNHLKGEDLLKQRQLLASKIIRNGSTEFLIAMRSKYPEGNIMEHILSLFDEISQGKDNVEDKSKILLLYRYYDVA